MGWIILVDGCFKLVLVLVESRAYRTYLIDLEEVFVIFHLHGRE